MHQKTSNIDIYNITRTSRFSFLQVTLCKIGSKNVVDPSAEEESCTAVSQIVGITGNPKNYVSSQEADKMPDVEGKCTTIGMSGPGSVANPTLKNALKQGV